MFEVYAQDYRITIQEIPLGNQGEDMARCLVIDITDAVNEFGSGGTVSVRNKRNGDELPYFCTNVSTVTGADAEGNVHTYIKWTLTDVDTAAAGSGFVQADYIISGTTVKTWVYKYFILPSLGITGDVPDPYEDILEEIEAQVSAVQTAAASAAASAAQASAEATRIITTTESVVEDWLADHIVTGYTVDDTLTISGAAADSEKAGDMIRAAFVTEETSGSIASFADGADGVPLRDLVVNISPVQSGTGDPSPSNVRAISGWTGAKIYATGKNVFTVYYPTASVPGGATQFVLPLKPNTYYTCSSNCPQSTPANCYFGGTSTADNGVYDGQARTVRSNANGYIYFTVRNASQGGGSINLYQALIDGTYWLQVEEGQTATEYEPFGDTYDISFGSAGTVYGGTLDVTTGMLTVTRALRVLNGSEAWSVNSATTNLYYTGSSTFSGLKADGFIASSMFTATYVPEAQMAIGQMKIAGTNVNFKTNSATLNDWKAALQQNNVQVIYELANPIGYQLTPTEVKSLLANNNIFADTGSVASCEYRADTKLYLEKLTNPDDDMVANANITSGSYFMVGNSLYLATANIANGGAITPGTNCTATNLAAALNAINS